MLSDATLMKRSLRAHHLHDDGKRHAHDVSGNQKHDIAGSHEHDDIATGSHAHDVTGSHKWDAAHDHAGQTAHDVDGRHVVVQATGTKATVQDRLEIEAMILEAAPIKHLKQKLMHEKRMDAEEVVEKMGDQMPAQITALVKSSQKQHTGQPFSEESLTKARKILNGMVEDAQGRLDKKMIACKEFYDRNRGTFKQIRTDLARLGEQIADLIRLIADSNKGIQETDATIAALEEERAMKTKEYMTIKSADDIEMTSRRNDLAVAEFILKFTVCSDKKPPKFMLAQSDAGGQPSSFNVMRCEDP